MNIQTKYNVGQKVYVSFNQLNDITGGTTSTKMTLHQDFPLLGMITRVSISAEEAMDIDNRITYWTRISQIIKVHYRIKILSPSHNSVNIPEYCFPEIDHFYEEDIFSSIEEMEEYMISKGTYFLQRGLTEEDIKQIIKDNEI